MIKKILDIFKKEKPIDIDHDNFHLFEGVFKYVIDQKEWLRYGSRIKFTEIPEYLDIKSKKPHEKVKIVFDLLLFIKANQQAAKKNKKDKFFGSSNYSRFRVCIDLLDLILSSTIKFDEKEIIEVFYSFKNTGSINLFSFPVSRMINQTIKYGSKNSFSVEFSEQLKGILKWKEFEYRIHNSAINKAYSKLEQALYDYSGNSENKQIPRFKFDENDSFGIQMNQLMDDLNSSTVVQWVHLLNHVSCARTGKPSGQFIKKVDGLINEIKTNNYKKIIHEWILILLQKDIETIQRSRRYSEQVFLTPINTTTIKGIVWSLQRFHDAETLRILSDLALKCYHKIPGVGAMAQALGNACVYVLAQSKGLNGISYLTRLKLRVTQNNTKKLIQKYIDEKAAKLKLLPSQIEEIAVLDYKFSDGQRSDNFDEYKLVSKITAIGKITLQWIKADGKLQKTVPAFVKKSKTWSDKLKSIKASNKQAAQSLTAQRDRIDNMFLENRRWNKEDFEKHYLTHGLMGFISKRLVWLFDDKAVIWHEGGFKTNQNQPVLLSDSTKISLWHPIFSTSKEIITWRDFLDDNQIKQPLKQVYREIYVLTDAEIKTNTYSNRMAAHILKQHQFNALAKIRNWKYALSGCFDNGGAGELASKEIPAYDLFAEFWINELTDVESYNDSGIWDYIATDQVKFLNQQGEAIELAQIPALVFSEIMRDCDLFVGVASVGNDPQWQDNGGERQYYDYWNDYSFGHLSELAKTRKTVLERLIPRLKIANQLSIKDKFLQVKGTRHTYDIHIGSGNILIQPHNKYLCIVAGRKSRAVDNVFLPFEGDRGLSMVLSKAFLLANDNKITDKTILSQL